MVGDEGVNASDGRFLLHLLRRLAVALLAALAIVGLLSLVAVFVVGSGLRAETPKRIRDSPNSAMIAISGTTMFHQLNEN